MPQLGRLSSRIDPSLSITTHRAAILRELAVGNNAGEISFTLHIAECTVYEHVEEVRRQLGARNMADLVRLAILHGFVDASG